MKSKTSPGKSHPTTTVSQSRLPIFAPVTRQAPNKTEARNVTYNTPYGSCTVKNCQLTQVHRDVIEAIFTHHTNVYRHDNGDITYFFNPYKIMRKMGWERPSSAWFHGIVEKLRTTTLHVRHLDWHVTTGIVLRHAYREIDTSEKATSTKFGEGRLYAVQFSVEFLRVFDMDMNVHYPQLVDDILAVESALARATIRFFLTHQRESRLGADTLLLTIGAVTELPDNNNVDNYYTEEQKALRKALSDKIEKLTRQKNVLAQFGIVVDGLMLTYQQHKMVWFENCPSPKKEKVQGKKLNSPKRKAKLVGKKARLAGTNS